MKPNNIQYIAYIYAQSGTLKGGMRAMKSFPLPTYKMAQELLNQWMEDNKKYGAYIGVNGVREYKGK